MLIPFESNGLWGYMNSERQIILQPQFEEAYPTFELRGRVKKDHKYGFIDNLGKQIIEIKYEKAGDYHEGAASVERMGRKYYIDWEGKLSQPSPRPLYSCGGGGNYFIQSLDSSLIFQDHLGNYGIIGRRRTPESKPNNSIFVPDTLQITFDTVVAVTHQLMYVKKDQKLAFTHNGYYTAGADAILAKMDFIYSDVKFFTSSFRPTDYYELIGVKKNGLWGYMYVFGGLQGEVIIEPMYYSITSLEPGFALVEYLPGKFGYIDRGGNEYFFRNNHTNKNDR